MLENEYLQPRARRRTRSRRSRRPPATTSACTSRRTADFYVGVAPTVGRVVRHACWSQLADLVEEYGVAGARLTPYQKLVVLDVDADRRRARSSPASTTIGLSARPSHWRRNTMACTGIEFCKLAIVETKDRGRATWSPSSSSRFPDLDAPITVNVNGCPNACARTQVADIGLKGQLVLDADGNQVEGFQVHLGGGARARRRLRPQAARPQGDQRRPRRLRRARSSRHYLADRERRRVVRRLGRPRRRGPAARRADWRRVMSERAQSRSTAPTAATRTCWPHEDAHGAWECRVVPARVHA